MKASIALQTPILSTIILALLAFRSTSAQDHAVRDILTNIENFNSLSHQSLSTLVGLHVIYSWPGATIPQNLLDLTQQGKVGGVIIFGENVNDDLPDQIANLQNVYKKSAGYIGSPLLITTDQEGGIVVRLPGGPKKTAKEVGSSRNPAAAASKAGVVAANACKAYNVNGNLAPVLDVYRVAGDFDDQYGRSFSMNPKVVKACGAAWIKSQQAADVVATSKHWPGLGAASTDENTDLGPVTLDVSLKDLRTIDELPFIGAIAAGVSMIMPSWAIYPALDLERPSGLSPKWIKSELRGRLGFKGVTISDALEAGALGSFGSNATRAVLAVQAGMDIGLASGRNVSQGESVHHGLISALKSGKISKAEFAVSTKRILNLRRSLSFA